MEEQQDPVQDADVKSVCVVNLKNSNYEENPQDGTGSFTASFGALKALGLKKAIESVDLPTNEHVTFVIDPDKDTPVEQCPVMNMGEESEVDVKAGFPSFSMTVTGLSSDEAEGVNIAGCFNVAIKDIRENDAAKAAADEDVAETNQSTTSFPHAGMKR